MEYLNIFKECVTSKYADFKGSASRTEFWTFTVITWLLNVILVAIKIAALSSIVGLLLLIPTLAVGVRRLHDRGKSGWWYLIALVPVVGIIYLIYLWATKK